jgi:chromosome segregation ATPase
LEHTIRSKAAMESEKLHGLKESAASFPIPDKMTLNQVQQEREQIQEELDESERGLQELQDLESWIQRLQELTAAESQVFEANAEAEARLADLQNQRLRVEEAKPAEPFEEAVGYLDSLKSEKEIIQSKLAQLEQNIPSREDRLRDLDEQLRQSQIELEKANKQMAERADELSEASLRDSEIELENQRFLEAVSQLETMERARKQKTERQAEVNRQLAVLQKEHHKLRNRLADHSADQDLELDMAAIERGLKRIEEIQLQLKDLQAERAKVLKGERSAARELEGDERAIRKLRDKTSQLGRRKTELVQHIDELMENKSLEYWTAHIQERRLKLAACRELSEIGRRYREQGLNGDIPGMLIRVNS